jgi:para-aminobenzoate synthetase / 4-amino-4-deoxychorismate lyase
VWDSQCNEEYEECKIKASVLSSDSDENFYVFDSLLLEDGSLYLLDKHVKRLQNSASFFYTYASETLENLFSTIREELASAAKQNPAGSYKVLTSITKDLSCNITLEGITISNHPLKLAVMNDTVYTKTPYFTHKTSFRNIYTGIKNHYPHADDVLLINENGEATETTRGNILIQTEEGFFTPPLSSGLLAGTYREYLLETNQCREKILYEKDIRSAQKVWMINSVRRKVLCTVL